MNGTVLSAVKPTVVTLTAPKCGTCIYAQQFKSNMADCYGMPPHPVVMGQGRDPLGRSLLQVEAMVPRVNQDRPACSLYKRKSDFATSGNS